MKSTIRVVTRYGSGIKGLKRAGIRDHSPGIWNHNACYRDQQCFSWNQESGIKFLQVQGSKFSSFFGSGIQILGKSMGSVTEIYTSLRPCIMHLPVLDLGPSRNIVLCLHHYAETTNILNQHISFHNLLLFNNHV